MSLTIRDLPREYIIAAQRRRAVEAVAEIAHEFGLAAATTTAVCRVGKMARGTYYRLFEGSSGCLRYSFAQAYQEVLGPMHEIEGGNGEYRPLYAVKLEALFASVAARPLLAALCLVHSHGYPKEAAGNGFEAAVGEVAQVLSGASRRAGKYPNPLLDEYLARSILSLVASRALHGEVEKLPGDGCAMVALIGAYYPV